MHTLLNWICSGSVLCSQCSLQAHRLEMQYPKYVFLTYGTYEPQWWVSQSNPTDDECTSDDIAYTLQFSLAVSQFTTSTRENNNIFYHVCYDAVFSLAYALERVFENEDNKTSWNMCNKTKSECCQYIDNSYTSSLINERLRDTDFIGCSVSVKYCFLKPPKMKLLLSVDNNNNCKCIIIILPS